MLQLENIDKYLSTIEYVLNKMFTCHTELPMKNYGVNRMHASNNRIIPRFEQIEQTVYSILVIRTGCVNKRQKIRQK